MSCEVSSFFHHVLDLLLFWSLPQRLTLNYQVMGPLIWTSFYFGGSSFSFCVLPCVNVFSGVSAIVTSLSYPCL